LKRFLFLFFCSLFLCAAVAQAQIRPPTVDQTWRAVSEEPVEWDSQSGLQELILCAGDSITVGDPYCPGATADGCTVNFTFVPRLSVFSGFSTVNKGYGGVSSSYGADNIDAYLSQYNPQILTIYYGNNDAGNYYTDIVISNLRYIVDRCLLRGTRPVIATLGPQFGDWEYRQPYILDINDGIRQLAAEKGISVADIGAALWGRQDCILEDGIHPNVAGHEIIAYLFYTAINKCAYGISPSSEYFKHSGGTGTVSVTTGAGGLCSWTAVSNVDWIEVTGSSSGVGSGTVTYQVAFNNTGRARTGTLTIAGKTFTVSRKKAPTLNFLPLLLEE